ncbi:Bdr family repetitive protein [Borreliella garinii]|uniref:Bdr family repetitive protein n=1 Tax=Borreliella garinii TaxID=29519 RepID=UPI00018ACF73|nr:Bdr family repetitive protein [Borreliella garinii]ACL35240.1 repeat motif-containing protein [Borreliella garinii Far04]WNZ67147.1 Bdr family repetitive protein [Borreliella garinii]WNZ68146.1 Bdr family repetitive protein [Borreliella garinii]WNZ69144.1 Bdr family repetitive protein [Borreliella garinii]WNZ70144.1 Bdr family repetitive protein [Borreliella garinii]
MKPVLTNTVSITEEQIYNEFIRLEMEQLIAQDLSKRYYHNELTYRDLENLKKQFGIKFDNFVFKIDTVEKNLQKDMSNLDAKIDVIEKNLNDKIDFVEKNLKQDISNLEQNLKKEMQINNKLLLEKLKMSNRIITIAAIVAVPITISIITTIAVSLITRFFK